MTASGLACGLHFFRGNFIPSLVTKLVLAIRILTTSRDIFILSAVQAANPMASEKEENKKNRIGLDRFFFIGAILGLFG